MTMQLATSAPAQLRVFRDQVAIANFLSTDL